MYTIIVKDGESMENKYCILHFVPQERRTITGFEQNGFRKLLSLQHPISRFTRTTFHRAASNR